MCTRRSKRRIEAQEREDLQRRLDIIRWSYGEVLDATKHQDDKIGRFLTAIAFLSTGAIALMFRTELVAYRWRVGQSGRSSVGYGDYPLLACFAGAFFLCVLLAVWLLLSSLSAPLRAPGAQARYGPSFQDSRLFFTHIAKERGDVWERRWRDRETPEIEREILGHYVNETHNLAERADGKYTQTRMGAALFGVGLSYLAVSILLALVVVAGGTPSGRLSLIVRIAIGSILGGHVWLQLHSIILNQMTSVQLKEDAMIRGGVAERLWLGVQSLRKIQPLCLIYALAILMPRESTLERVIGGASAAAAAILAVSITRARWRPGQGSRLAAAERVLEFGVAPAVLAAVSLLLGGVFPLILAACLPLGLGWLLNTRNLPRLVKGQGHAAAIGRS